MSPGGAAPEHPRQDGDAVEGVVPHHVVTLGGGRERIGGRWRLLQVIDSVKHEFSYDSWTALKVEFIKGGYR